MTDTTLVTADAVDIARLILMFLVLEEVVGVLRFSSEPAHHSLFAYCLSGG